MNLSNLKRMMTKAGVRRLYVKRLAPNDNSKNQVYLGADLATVNIIPNHGVMPERVRSTSGKKDGKVEYILKAPLAMEWLDDNGNHHAAPGAQLILYPQYPEVRMSGFLQRSTWAPSEVMKSREPARALFLGVADGGKIIAYAAARNSTVVSDLDDARDLTSVGVFQIISLTPKDSRHELLAQLRRIHHLEWIDSKKLKASGEFGPCNASNCGGYTLEAELGITPNSFSEPDFHGWEIKQHTVARFDRLQTGILTLMTPEPTEGYYRDAGLEAFIRRFGYADKRGRPDRLNFGGIHRVGTRTESTGLELTLVGYDIHRRRVTDVNGGVCLLSDAGEIAAKWPYAGLIEHWQRKHARAAYIPSQSRRNPALQYRYGQCVRIAQGTDFLRFLSAMADGAICYDPGIKLEQASSSKPHIKRRSQFRVRSAQLSRLYADMQTVDLIEADAG